MKYSKDQLTRSEKPKPELGWTLMRVKREMPNKNNEGQHSFILENETSSFFFNCWLPELPDFATACGVSLDENGIPDTADFVNHWVRVFFIDKQSKKDGKFYRNIGDYEAVTPDEVEGLMAEDAKNPEGDSDIPF